MTIKELEKQIKELQDEVKALKNPKKIWTKNWAPGSGKTYYYKDKKGDINSDDFDGWEYDYLVFPTVELCQRYIEYEKAKKEYTYEFTEEEWGNSNIIKWYIFFNYVYNEIQEAAERYYKKAGIIYFKKNEDILKFIDKYEEEIKVFDLGIGGIEY